MATVDFSQGVEESSRSSDDERQSDGMDPTDLAGPPSMTLTKSKATNSFRSINVTKLDCGMRELALEFAKTLKEDDPEILQQVFDALRLDALCGSTAPSTNFPMQPTMSKTKYNMDSCKSTSVCLYVVAKSTETGISTIRRRGEDGSQEHPFTSIHAAIQAFRTRRLLQAKHSPNITSSMSDFTIVLRGGIHELQGKPIQLSRLDSGLSIVGQPGEQVWLSGGILVHNVSFEETSHVNPSLGVYVGNLTELLKEFDHKLPHIVSLFSTDRRWIRARYPNSNPETDQWGYASPNRMKYSISGQEVLEWHLPPKGRIPNFTFVDFQDNPPPGVPMKNNSKQRGYNWYASGHGGVCADVWGPQADSYWCSNASQGGWSEVDQECATTGQIQLPTGLNYNTTSELRRLQGSDLKGGILHAWHSQSWAMHMFEITHHYSKAGVIQLAKGGG